MHGTFQFTTKLFSLLIIYCVMVNSSHAATISIDGLDALVLKKTELSSGEDVNLNIIYNGNVCTFPKTIFLTSAKISSDKKFVILNNKLFLNWRDIKYCNLNTDTIGQLNINPDYYNIEDINEQNNLIALYVDPLFGWPYAAKRSEKFTLMAALVDMKNLSEIISIKKKPFYNENRTDSIELDKHSFINALSTDKAFFSPNGKYLALKSSAISCKKGAYPGVFETTHWKQVIFNGPDSNKKCRALFPQLK
ncbi:hypothetical protein [Aquitalea pelogenes]|uniref:hypothetical protein n=1 Tax=Aquitalea pelogenes TaxID=1293573 RepID=UPI0035ADB283